MALWMARFRSLLGIFLTVFWSLVAVLLRPFWRNSVVVAQRLWSRTTIWVGGVTVRVVGSPPPSLPVVYVANHQSGLDIMALLGFLPDTPRFVAKKEMANAPFTGWAMRLGDYIFIDRSNRAEAVETLKRAGQALRQGGRSVIVFPEGTRYPPGQLGPFKAGAIHLARAADVPLVPIGLRNTGVLMERRRLMSLPGVVELHMGEPVAPAAWEGRDAELLNHLRQQVRVLAGPSAAMDAPEFSQAESVQPKVPVREGSGRNSCPVQSAST